MAGSAPPPVVAGSTPHQDQASNDNQHNDNRLDDNGENNGSFERSQGTGRTNDNTDTRRYVLRCGSEKQRQRRSVSKRSFVCAKQALNSTGAP